MNMWSGKKGPSRGKFEWEKKRGKFGLGQSECAVYYWKRELRSWKCDQMYSNTQVNTKVGKLWFRIDFGDNAPPRVYAGDLVSAWGSSLLSGVATRDTHFHSFESHKDILDSIPQVSGKQGMMKGGNALQKITWYTHIWSHRFIYWTPPDIVFRCFLTHDTLIGWWSSGLSTRVSR